MKDIKSECKEGSVLGGVLLLAGSCIGAGMLALPVITSVGGFIPTLFILFFSWIFMTATGLLLLEANLVVGHDLSLVSIAERTLGKGGKVLCWVLFVFLFYSLSVAYIAASGDILQSILADFFGVYINPLMGSLLFAVVFAVALLIGTRHVDYLNRILMIGLIIAYALLISLGIFYIHSENLEVVNWLYSFAAIPIMIVSFGFHNMIPSLAMYLQGDKKRLRRAIIMGSMIPLLVYILWEVVMLGIIPLYGRGGLLEALIEGEVVTGALRETLGFSWVNTIAHLFALFAVITSFLAQSLSLVDFLADGLKISKIRWGRCLLVALTLVPPFSFAFVYPGIFIQALNIAGGFAAVILFCIMPALMVWKIRYKMKNRTFSLFPSGRAVLLLIILIAVGIFLLELAQELGVSLIPKEMEVVP